MLDTGNYEPSMSSQSLSESSNICGQRFHSITWDINGLTVLDPDSLLLRCCLRPLIYRSTKQFLEAFSDYFLLWFRQVAEACDDIVTACSVSDIITLVDDSVVLNRETASVSRSRSRCGRGPGWTS